LLIRTVEGTTGKIEEIEDPFFANGACEKRGGKVRTGDGEGRNPSMPRVGEGGKTTYEPDELWGGVGSQGKEGVGSLVEALIRKKKKKTEE